MKIITLTFNPAFDLHYYIDKLQPFSEAYARDFGINAGGKGVNISRALTANGVDNTAYILLGEDNADSYISALQKEGLPFEPLLVKGRIRENITIHETSLPETRISLDNFTLSDKTLDALYTELKHVVDSDTIIAYSGRVPKGVTPAKTIMFLNNLKALGAWISIDSNTFTCDELREISPWLLKLNASEAANLSPSYGHGDGKCALMLRLLESGVANIIISDGGAKVLYSGEFDCEIMPPVIEPVSTIGAGDSLVAGFIAAYASGADIETCLKNAVAYATAACLQPGTMPPLPDDVASLMSLIKLSRS